MNELDPFEKELQRLKPARPPQEFMNRLTAALENLPQPKRRESHRSVGWLTWPSLVRWLAPAMAVAVVLVGLNWHVPGPAAKSPGQRSAPASSPMLKADNVEIDRRLIGAFDAVARMPGGEPVRFRCREWADNVVLRDSTRGITIERSTPRLEVIPVGLETY